MQAGQVLHITTLLQNRGTKSHTKRLKSGPLLSYKRLNCESCPFWIQNDVKTLGKEREFKDVQSFGALSFLGHLLTATAQKSIGGRAMVKMLLGRIVSDSH